MGNAFVSERRISFQITGFATNASPLRSDPSTCAMSMNSSTVGWEWILGRPTSYGGCASSIISTASLNHCCVVTNCRTDCFCTRRSRSRRARREPMRSVGQVPVTDATPSRSSSPRHQASGSQGTSPLTQQFAARARSAARARHAPS